MWSAVPGIPMCFMSSRISMRAIPMAPGNRYQVLVRKCLVCTMSLPTNGQSLILPGDVPIRVIPHNVHGEVPSLTLQGCLPGSKIKAKLLRPSLVGPYQRASLIPDNISGRPSATSPRSYYANHGGRGRLLSRRRADSNAFNPAAEPLEDSSLRAMRSISTAGGEQ